MVLHHGDSGAGSGTLHYSPPGSRIKTKKKKAGRQRQTHLLTVREKMAGNGRKCREMKGNGGKHTRDSSPGHRVARQTCLSS